MIAHSLTVDADGIAQLAPFAILFYGVSLLNWIRRSSRNTKLTRAGATAYVRKILYVIDAERLPVVAAVARDRSSASFTELSRQR